MEAAVSRRLLQFVLLLLHFTRMLLVAQFLISRPISAGRTQLGHQIYKCAAQVFILSGIFHEGQTTRMAGKVAEFIRLCANIRQSLASFFIIASSKLT
jgi:hypothetical protein